jgi:hypothetical protein
VVVESVWLWKIFQGVEKAVDIRNDAAEDQSPGYE